MSTEPLETIYCPFINEEIPRAESSIEHIIPESAGGSDTFTIRCSKKANNDLGSLVDAPAIDNFFAATMRILVGIPNKQGGEPKYSIPGYIETKGEKLRAEHRITPDSRQVVLLEKKVTISKADGAVIVSVVAGSIDEAREMIKKRAEREGLQLCEEEIEKQLASVIPTVADEFHAEIDFKSTCFQRAFIKMSLATMYYRFGKDICAGSEAQLLRNFMWDSEIGERETIQIPGSIWPAHTNYNPLFICGSSHVFALLVVDKALVFSGILFGEYPATFLLIPDCTKYSIEPSDHSSVVFINDPLERRLTTMSIFEYISAKSEVLI